MKVKVNIIKAVKNLQLIFKEPIKLKILTTRANGDVDSLADTEFIGICG